MNFINRESNKKENPKDNTVLTESQLEVYEYYEKFLLCSQYEDLHNNLSEDSGVISIQRMKLLLQKLIQMRYVAGTNVINALKHISFQSSLDQFIADGLPQESKYISFEEFLSFLKVHNIHKIDQHEKHIEALTSSWELFDADFVDKQEFVSIMQKALQKASGIGKEVSPEKDKEWKIIWEHFVSSVHYTSKDRINEIEWKEMWNRLMGMEPDLSHQETSNMKEEQQYASMNPTSSIPIKKLSLWNAISRNTNS